MKAKLYTQAGDFVVEVELPPFNQWPDVLVWGERFFIVNGQASYREAFTYFVPIFEKKND